MEKRFKSNPRTYRLVVGWPFRGPLLCCETLRDAVTYLGPPKNFLWPRIAFILLIFVPTDDLETIQGQSILGKKSWCRVDPSEDYFCGVRCCNLSRAAPKYFLLRKWVDTFRTRANRCLRIHFSLNGPPENKFRSAMSFKDNSRKVSLVRNVPYLGDTEHGHWVML